MLKLERFSNISEEDLNEIIKIHFNHWSQYTKFMDLERTTHKFKNIYTDNGTLPLGFTLYDNNRLIGFVVLKKDNLTKYPDITPWIDDVMILKEYRNKGYGRKMINLLLEEMKKLGYQEAYLWTDKTPDFYKKIGFEFKMMVEKNNNEGQGELYYKKI